MNRSIDNPAVKAAILQHIDQEVKEAAAVFAEYLDGIGEMELSKTGVAPENRPQSEKNDEVISVRKKVITFGDQKACSNVRSIRNRAPDEFSTFMEKPGDFHTEGYLAQCCGKILGPGGFYYVMRQLLGRHQVTSKSFQKIFKGNLERNIDRGVARGDPGVPVTPPW